MEDLSIEKLQQLIDVVLAVNDSYDNFEVVLQRLLHAIELLTDCDSSSFLVFEENRRDLVFRLVSGPQAHDIIGLVVPHGKGIAHLAANEKRGMIVNDLLQKNEDSHGGQHFSGIDKRINYNTYNLMAFPLCDENGDVFGIVEACNKNDKQDFTNEDFRIFSLFCQQAERIVRHALKVHLLEEKAGFFLKRLNQCQFTEFIYASKEMETKMDFIKNISSSNAQLLIWGESGVGKTTFAKEIHKHSLRSQKPLEIVNCPALMLQYKDEKDIYMYIFGAQRNYKLGIRSMHDGTLQRCAGGSVVFEDIGYLPLSIQESILQLIKTRSYLLCGAEKVTQNIDIRILATSSQNLEKMSEEKQFNEELYYLLNSMNVYLSPLRNRPDDIQALAYHYFSYYIKKYKKMITKILPKVYFVLKKHMWTANVPELKNVIQRAVLLCNSDVITLKYFNTFFTITDDALGSDENSIIIDREESKIGTLKDAVDGFKRQYIYRALINNNWSHTKTSKILDIQRSYLSRLVKTYNLRYKISDEDSMHEKL